MSEEQGSGDVRFARRLLIAIVIVGIALLLWQVRFVLVLAFAAVLLAVILRSAVHSLHRRLHLPEGLALAIAVALGLGSVAGMLFLFGAEIAQQAEAIENALPAALEQLRALTARLGIEGWVDQQIERFSDGAMSGNLGGILINVGNSITDLVIVLVAGVFLAARPRLYRTGFIKLVPPSRRPVAGDALNDCETALRLWFKGRLLAMAGVGLLVGFGLWLIGVPSFVALGLLAALLEIIPFLGPILAAVPGILLALLLSPTHALLAAGLYLVIQQAEGNLITPIIQHHAVELPPALLLFSLLAFGLLFGLLGVLLAEPLTVVLFVLVKKLYVQRTLDTRTPIPGEED